MIQERKFTAKEQTWRVDVFPLVVPEPEDGVLFRAYCKTGADSWACGYSGHIAWERWYIVGETEYTWKLAKAPGDVPFTRRHKRARKQFAFTDPNDALKSLRERTKHRVWHAERAYLNALAAQVVMEEV